MIVSELLSENLGKSKLNEYCFYFWNLEINVKSDLVGLDEYIHRYLNSSSPINHKKVFRIVHLHDSSLIEKLHLIFCSTYYTRVKTHKNDDSIVDIYYTNDNRVVISQNRLFAVIVENETELTLITTNDYSNSCVQVLRVIRELLFFNAESDSSVIFHCAAVSKQDNGIMICGTKGSGKTTTMIKLLELGYDFISNDRVVVGNDVNFLVVSSVPLPIRLGYGTAKKCEKMKYIDDFKFSRFQQIYSPKNNNYKSYGSEIKYELSPVELSEIMSVNRQTFSRLKLIIFPKFLSYSIPMTIDFIDIHEAKRALLENCMTPFDEDWIARWIYSTNANLLNENKEEMIESILNDCKVIRITYGIDCKISDFNNLDKLIRRETEEYDI